MDNISWQSLLSQDATMTVKSLVYPMSGMQGTGFHG